MDEVLTRDELEQFATGLWSELPAGAVVWLSGELGSGKTTFVQALTRAADAEPARSPTYALVHEYAGPDGPIVHVDAYRLRHPDEAADLDLDAIARRSRALLIEWPERAGTWAPRPDVRLTFVHHGTEHRRIVRR